jgi:hypothetical protein
VNIDEMTEQEVRDYLAECAGRHKEADGLWYGDPEWPNHGFAEHPVPPTIDSAAGCLPEGYEWTGVLFRCEGHDGPAAATAIGPGAPVGAKADTERLARFRAAAKAWAVVRKESGR